MMEALKAALGDELFAQVTKALEGKDKVKLANLAGGGYVSVDKFQASERAQADLKTQIAARDKQLEGLKATTGDAEALKKQIAELQAANKTATEKLAADLASARMEYALETRLLKEGTVNSRAVLALLDRSKISLDGDNLLGVDEQIKTLREKEKWAFKEATGVPGSGGNPPGPDGKKPQRPTGTVSF